MPAVHARTGTRRRTISEINMVPFIDVMLVLLIIFMVSAPLLTTAVVDLPSVGKGRAAPQKLIEVVVAGDESVRLRIDGKEGDRVALPNLAARLKQAQQGVAGGTAIVISGDRGVRYEAVVKVLDTLNRAQVGRVGLLVRTTGN